ncbi:MAG: DUF2029 domain-containing protein [Anaerolineales bacterium]|nr:DUF2029 domain-containing protein [Anaerolineales bacterium]
MQIIAERKNKKLTPEQLRTFHTYASIFAFSLMGILFAKLFWNLVQPRMDFYNELWAPAHLLVNGQSPYETASLNTNLPAAWFPMAIGFFFPLGWLSEETAQYVWFIFCILELGVIVHIAQGNKRSLYNTVIITLLSLFFPSTLYHFYIGQISITVTLCLLLAVRFAQKDRQWLSAFFAALAISKPHLALLTILGLSLFHYQNGKLRSLFAFWGRVSVVSLALCIPLFIAYPNWIPDALHAMTQNPIWSYPSLFVLFQRYFDAWGILLWICTSIVTIWISQSLWKKLPPVSATYWSLSLAPLVSPYVGSWDFVILLPLLTFTFANLDWKRKIFLVIFYAIAWVQMAQIQALEVSHNHYFWWVPLWFLGISALLTKLNPSTSTVLK